MADLDMGKKENLIVHIEGLQATITKRNERISQLEAQIAGEGADEREQRALKKAHRQGWQECASHLMETTRQAAFALGQVRKDAFAEYLKSESADV